MKIIGICGYARSGKNLFADIATRILKNKKCKSLSLAFQLRKDLNPLLIEKTGISAFTENSKEKLIIRPMLVSYGNMMRDITEGKFWTDRLEKTINEKYSDYDYIFVTDVRYDQYEKDEVYWIKNKMNGNLIHVSKYIYQTAPSKRHVHTSKPLKTWNGPANEYERFNDPKLKKNSDVIIEWEDIEVSDKSEEYLVEIVKYALKKINISID